MDRQALWFCGATKQAIGTDQPFQDSSKSRSLNYKSPQVRRDPRGLESPMSTAGCGWTHAALTLADVDLAASNHACGQPAKELTRRPTVPGGFGLR